MQVMKLCVCGLIGSVRISKIILLTSAMTGSFSVHAQDAQPPSSQPRSSTTAVATFAGGCFWCMEPPYDKLDGVLSTTSGFIGGSVPEPSYEQVLTGRTGHAEAVQITYNPDIVSYERLLTVFWQNFDPLDASGQFCDRGSQYRSAIFYHSHEQRQLAESSRDRLERQATLPGPIVTEIVAADTDDFYPAEDYHQNYYQNNPLRYRFYRWNCGRDERLEELWAGK